MTSISAQLKLLPPKLGSIKQARITDPLAEILATVIDVLACPISKNRMI